MTPKQIKILEKNLIAILNIKKNLLLHPNLLSKFFAYELKKKKIVRNSTK